MKLDLAVVVFRDQTPVIGALPEQLISRAWARDGWTITLDTDADEVTLSRAGGIEFSVPRAAAKAYKRAPAGAAKAAPQQRR